MRRHNLPKTKSGRSKKYTWNVGRDKVWGAPYARYALLPYLFDFNDFSGFSYDFVFVSLILNLIIHWKKQKIFVMAKVALITLYYDM